ncbi:MAG: anti-sigma factor family protein [Candidatus Binatia bacterium]
MNCKEAGELVTALVDNELTELERNSVESHLKNCLRCQYIYKQEQELKRQIGFIGARITAPSDLKARILSDRRIFPGATDSSGEWRGLFWPAKVVLRPAFALALLVLLVLPIFYLMWPSGEAVSLAALETHGKIVTGDISFIRAESREKVKELLYRSVERRFAPMGYDLSRVGLKAVGGLVQEVGGRRILVTVYEGKGPSLSCFTFLGTVKDVPPKARLFFDPDKKINFYTFSNGQMNGVMRRVGGRICILVSKMPMGELLDLARSIDQRSYS